MADAEFNNQVEERRLTPLNASPLSKKQKLSSEPEANHNILKFDAPMSPSVAALSSVFTSQPTQVAQLPRRRAPVARCSSPSHFLASESDLIQYGDDYLLDLPLVTRVNSLLAAIGGMHYPVRRVVPPDMTKVWTDQSSVRYTTIERLQCAVRKRRCEQDWTLKEVALFQLAFVKFGKEFNRVSSMVGTKSTSQCVDYYYNVWKQSKNYQIWKNHAELKREGKTNPSESDPSHAVDLTVE